MSTEQRPEGYFWCRLDPNVRWEVAYWNGAEWECTGDKRVYSDKVWFEIDPLPIIRKENE